ncbi:MAG: hypothetical protein A2741_00430 [Candidatus Zambryskibacteria bacterium RIFCSPHIGHO2_01_FULL_43_27]|uniref:Glycosyl transferase family 1 domain-containing protein n=1 Tax=Candidatus Zambryskibacteria bacterium RIFCSPLOWO2_01_FULL_43_17 TaxID=1802760 RepID=A0A1G2U3U5_9BACT|nr:MAG: hypothetical protein A2741_00430 [Candidatus Zambryskibacteria bacterium RIFCSPHIGHO2_01_FULL_43_27]OHB00447.1 MAG: hypothetical protein A3E93_01285 [Candidatus Zambryskibacteria bacterium RIFCSPHIGHO2_12_FULL_43_12b]OHB03560.1 MAG: hypothetical protein A2920_02765 [Candidatus Zambryskibacteria bacterium RIFCSPLOWO2_01_FULL_43_17]
MLNSNLMQNILIVTGIFPPRIGGPAQYAKEVRNEWQKGGHVVKVLTYRLEHFLPTGIRHFLFFLRTCLSIRDVDFIFALDTFSVGFPATLTAKLFGKKIITRTGGDFLWEGYVERTGDKVLLRDFYETRKDRLDFKEKIIFHLTRWALVNNSAVIFSTKWQMNIFIKAYGLNPNRLYNIENFYGEKIDSHPAVEKIFVAGTRPLKWKNLDKLSSVFSKIQEKNPEIKVDLGTASYEIFLDKIKRSYAVILVSLGDISPNMILDAIRCNKPFIVTKETGIYDRIKDVAIFVDPENEEEIKDKILYLANDVNYANQVEKLEKFTFKHSWEEICREILNIAENVKNN